MLKINQIEEITEEIDSLLSGSDYYNGKTLLKKAVSREKPSTIVISTTTRSYGKTSYYIMFHYYLFQKYHKNVVYVVRQINELASYHYIYQDIFDMYGWDYNIQVKPLIKDTLYVHLLDGEVYAYVVCLKKADSLKKFSSLFANTELLLMEEYQIEDRKIMSREPQTLKSLLRTIGRGGGKMFREVLTVLLGNPVTLMNPYLIYFNIAHRYRGRDEYITSGQVTCEFSLQNAASEKVKDSSIVSNFKNSSDYDIGASFLYASASFMRKAPGKTCYILTLILDGKPFGIRRGITQTGLYCVKGVDKLCTNILTYNIRDMDETKMLMTKRSHTWKMLREAFEIGKLFFETVEIKEKMFDLLGIYYYN